MRCYSVSTTARGGLAVVSTPYPHVAVGESGRGRTLVRVPIGARFAAALGTEARGIDRTSVLRTERGTLLLVEEQPGDEDRALVLLDVPAGYRGGVEYSGIGYTLQPCHERGWDAGYPRQCTYCDQQYVPAAPDGRFAHPAQGGERRLYDAFPPEGVTVIARGERALGDAGRMGGASVHLAILSPGATVRARRTGRIYGDPPVLWIRWTGQELLVGPPDEVHPPTSQEEAGQIV